MAKIKSILAREILDSRANPTVETTVTLSDGSSGTASVPSGASTGAYEAVELRDHDPSRYYGKGVLKAVANVNSEISEALCNEEDFSQKTLDEKMIQMDGTKNKGRLGANAILSVSLAFAAAEAASKKLPLYAHLSQIACDCGCEKHVLPVPMMNILNGGVHAGNNLDFQEFMILPIPDIGVKQTTGGMFSQALRMGVEIYHSLQRVLSEKGFITAVGDEGGFAPDISDAFEALDLLMEGVQKAGYEPGRDVFFAMDAAASELHQADSGMYYFPGESRAKEKLLLKGTSAEQGESGQPTAAQPDTIRTQIRRSTEEMIEYYTELCEKYPLISIEDPLDEEDYEGFQKITKLIGTRVQIVGDDLFVTNPERLQMGIQKCLGNAILIKLNQIGSLTETITAVKMAKQAGYAAIISHRSGETEDTTIADLCVGLSTGQIKTGAPCRGERVAKYNRLLKIEEELKSQASFYTGKPLMESCCCNKSK